MLLKDYYHGNGSGDIDDTEQGMPGMLPGETNPQKVAPVSGASNAQVTPEMERNNRMNQDAAGPEVPVVSDGGGQIMAVTPKIQSIYDRFDNGEDPFRVMLNAGYMEQKKDLEKARKGALLGDIASVMGQMIASSMGARRFDKIESKVPAYNEQLRKLKERAYNADLNYSLNKARQDLEEKRYQERMNMERERVLQNQANADRDYRFRVAQADRNYQYQVGQADRAQRNLDREFGFKQDQDKWRRKETELARQENERYRKWLRELKGEGQTSYGAKSSSPGSGRVSRSSRKDVLVLPVARRDGSIQQVEIDRSKENMLIPLYERLRERLADEQAKVEAYNNTSEGRMNPIEIPFDMERSAVIGGILNNKAEKIAALYRFLPSMPELAEDVNRLFGDVVSVDETEGDRASERSVQPPKENSEKNVPGKHIKTEGEAKLPGYASGYGRSQAEGGTGNVRASEKPGGVYGSMLPGQEGPGKLDLSSLDVPYDEMNEEQKLQRLKSLRYRGSTWFGKKIGTDDSGKSGPGKERKRGSLLPGREKVVGPGGKAASSEGRKRGSLLPGRGKVVDPSRPSLLQ